MKNRISIAFVIGCVLAFGGCGGKIGDVNPTAGLIGHSTDSDPLKIGSKPTPPAKQSTPALVVGPIVMPEDKNKRFNTRVRTQITEEMVGKGSHNAVLPIKHPPLVGSSGVNAPPIPPQNGDWIVLMSPGGAALTVWALAQGNWIWGYTLIDSIGFGGARVWRLRFFDNDEVMIENGETRTCLNAYKNGLIHMACNTKNRYQRFKLIPMSNESFQLKNVGFDQCVQAPIGDIFGDFHRVTSIFLTKCATGSNLDQQWYVAPPTFLVRPLYRRDIDK